MYLRHEQTQIPSDPPRQIPSRRDICDDAFAERTPNERLCRDRRERESLSVTTVYLRHEQTQIPSDPSRQIPSRRDICDDAFAERTPNERLCRDRRERESLSVTTVYYGQTQNKDAGALPRPRWGQSAPSLMNWRFGIPGEKSEKRLYLECTGDSGMAPCAARDAHSPSAQASPGLRKHA